MQHRIVIRADASRSKGSGHLSRQLALSEQLLRENFEVVLIGALNEVPIIRDRVTSLGIKHISCKRGIIDVEQITSHSPNLVIVDSYEFDPKKISLVQKEVDTIAVIDGNDCGYKVSGYLDQNVFSNEFDYLDPTSTQAQFQLCGPKYALLRDSIVDLSKEYTLRQNLEIPKVTCFIGGTDPSGHIIKLAEMISKCDLNAEFLFIANKALHAELASILIKVNHRVTEPTNSLEKILSTSDAVICAAGTSVLEMSAIGIPTGYLIVASNQELNRKAIEDLEIGILLDLDPKNLDDFQGRLEMLIYNDKTRVDMNNSSKSTVDCLGKLRVTNKIKEVLN